ncbi:hypothetical protein CH339_15870 [Rhodobium orientis]|uniref:Outer membrane beta-barrel protein n=2 Tax=Rhodobium orientis TaxID=34017 RepID=A0A327JIA7_9HYPH|nr:hypothetical protein CH339_15870 [Rhodobium orientis]
MDMRGCLVALAVVLVAAVGPAHGQTANGDVQLRGSAPTDGGFSDDEDALFGATDDQTADSDAATPAADGTRTPPRPRSAEDARRERLGGRPEAVRAVQPVQPGPRNADGTVMERAETTVTAEAPEDNFGDDKDAYEPLGIRAGSFILKPSIETTGGGSTNVDQDHNGKSGAFYRIRPSLDVQSDWSRHSLNVNLNGEYTGYIDSATEDTPTFEGEATGRIDVRDGTKLELESGYQLEQEEAESAERKKGTDRADIHTLTGAAAIVQDVRRFQVRLRGSVERQSYDSNDGGTGRDYTLTEISLRTGYKVSPALMPYVEGSMFQRQLDDERDADGYRRSSDGYSLRGGVAIDMASKLTGDLAAGWRREEPRDGRLKALEGPTVDGTLTWSPSRLTTIALTGSTTLDTTTLTGSAGSIEYKGGLTATRSLRRNVKLVGALGLSYRDYESSPVTEWRRTADASVEWSFNRNVAAVARYGYEDLDSSERGNDYRAHSIEAGVILRH